MLHFEVMFGQLPCFKQQSVELPTLKGKTLSKSVPSAHSIVAPTLAHIEKVEQLFGSGKLIMELHI